MSTTPMRSNSAMPDWPINLTAAQALAYTNWKKDLLNQAEKTGAVQVCRDGKHGTKLFYRPSIDQYLKTRLNGETVDSEFDD